MFVHIVYLESIRLTSRIYRIKAASPPPQQAFIDVITPPRTNPLQQTSPGPWHAPTDLSSPFVEREKANRQGPGSEDICRPEIVTPKPVHSATVVELLSPAHIDGQPIEANPEISLEGESTRPAGGELERIRNHMSSLEMARQVELESRRPEFLKRIRIDADAEGQDVADGSTDNLGITQSPVKGRRLQLFDFQQTSEESFEQSLMTYGYTPYGELGTVTPHRPLAADARSQEAMDWLAYNTPIASAATPHVGTDEELSEKELKKRKRLEAFMGSAARAHAKLYPAEVEGYGRVLINVPPEEADSLFNTTTATPSKKRAPKRRRITSAEKRGKFSAVARAALLESRPRWLDGEFPWSLREKERVEELDQRNTDRLERINRYFSRDTDSEDDLDKKEGSRQPSPAPIPDKSEETNRRGRGKGVPLQANPARPVQRGHGVAGVAVNSSQFYPSDPADARTALMSKRSVRLLAYRRAQKENTSDSRGVCFCGMSGDEDDKAQVQCDECYTWYHTDCLGIKDVTELGGPDDPYYCYLCRPELHATTSNSSYLRGTAPLREPTFVPTEERSVDRGMNDVAFFTSSPMSATLQTPIRGPFPGAARRSLWDDAHHTSSGPSTPLMARGGVRIFTPNGEQAVYNPFSESPTRGAALDGHKDDYAAFATPKGWPALSMGAHHSGLLNTPVEGRGPFAFGYGYGFHDESGGGSRSGGFPAYHHNSSDTPIRRAPPRQAKPSLALRTAAVSPLAGRGDWSFPSFRGGSGHGESPGARAGAAAKRSQIQTQAGDEANAPQKAPAS